MVFKVLRLNFEFYVVKLSKRPFKKNAWKNPYKTPFMTKEFYVIRAIRITGNGSSPCHNKHVHIG